MSGQRWCKTLQLRPKIASRQLTFHLLLEERTKRSSLKRENQRDRSDWASSSRFSVKVAWFLATKHSGRERASVRARESTWKRAIEERSSEESKISANFICWTNDEESVCMKMFSETGENSFVSEQSWYLQSARVPEKERKKRRKRTHARVLAYGNV